MRLGARLDPRAAAKEEEATQAVAAGAGGVDEGQLEEGKVESGDGGGQTGTAGTARADVAAPSSVIPAAEQEQPPQLPSAALSPPTAQVCRVCSVRRRCHSSLFVLSA